MTFEYAPDWMENLLHPTACSSAGSGAARRSVAAAPPAHPGPRQVAALVGELFAEGTLSAEQFRSLLAAPELEAYLDHTLSPPLRIKMP